VSTGGVSRAGKQFTGTRQLGLSGRALVLALVEVSTGIFIPFLSLPPRSLG